MKTLSTYLLLASSLIAAPTPSTPPIEPITKSKLETSVETSKTHDKDIEEITFNYENSSLKFALIDWDKRIIYFRKQTLQGYEKTPSIKIPFPADKLSYLKIELTNPREQKDEYIIINPKERTIELRGE